MDNQTIMVFNKLSRVYLFGNCLGFSMCKNNILKPLFDCRIYTCFSFLPVDNNSSYDQ